MVSGSRGNNVATGSLASSCPFDAHSGVGAGVRIGTLDVLRHLFAVAVIFQHMPSKTRYSAELNHAIGALVSYVDGAVLGFFLISGLLSSGSSSNADFFASARRQAWRLLLPFTLFSLLYGVLLTTLGKSSLENSLWRLLTLQGSGPQLYFLPYLLAVWMLWTAALGVARRLAFSRLITVVAILLALAATTIAVPVPQSTGPAPELLALYAVAYGIGIAARSSVVPSVPASVSMGVLGLLLWAIGHFDGRFFDLALVVVLVALALLLHERGVLQGNRLPGSGGIYLLHTPIMNYAISAFLLFAGVDAGGNVALSVILTYIVCLAITLLLIRCNRRFQPLLLE